MNPADVVRELRARELYDLAATIARDHCCTVHELCSVRRTPALCMARHALWSELRDTGLWSYPRIAELCRVHRTTVMHGVKAHLRRAGVVAPAPGSGGSMRATLHIHTHNPNNGQTGNSKLAGILKARNRREQRCGAKLALSATLPERPKLPVRVVVRRVAPSAGIDPHDGLGAALKGVVDGIADYLGLPSDRCSSVRWDLQQRRGKPKEYAVEVEFHEVEAE